MVAWLTLLRVPNLATAVADVLAGFLVVAGLRTLEPPPAACWFAVVAGVCCYAGGVVFNDVCDVELDCRERPERPLPSGVIPVAAATSLARALLAGGVAAACAAALAARSSGPALVGAILTAAICVYDRWAKGTALGPAAMGACRGLAWLLGMTAAGGPVASHQWAIPAGMSIYVAGVTLFARDEAGRSRSTALAAGAMLMAAGLALAAAYVWLPMRLDAAVAGRPLPATTWLTLWGVIAGSIVLRAAVAILDPRPARVQAAVGNAIMSIITLDAILVLAACGEQWAVAVLLLLGVFVIGRRIVPPT